jgi:prepilin-type N-terminal cleavage/methylation domain-containing protein
MKIKTKKLNKTGFTLVEVMVSLAIAMLLVPGILATNLFLNKSMMCGFNKNINISKVRLFDEFFDQQISLTQKSKLAIKNSENTLTFTHCVDKEGKNWVAASFVYDPSTEKLSYTCNGNTKTWLEHAQIKDTIGAFTLSNGVARCHLAVGKMQPDYFTNLTVNLMTSATPRNP